MTYTFCGFDLDEERFELRRGDQPVKLEPRVLEVLVHLVRNRSRIVPKEELLDQVWKKTFVSESALTRCIMEARRALGDTDRTNPIIRTVHGRGYRFEGEVVEVDGTEVVETPAPILETPEPQPQSQPESRRKRWVGASLIAAGSILALSIGAGSVARMSRDGAGASSIHIALLPISVPVQDRELQLVSISLNDLLERRLAQAPRLVVRGADYSRPLSVDAPSLGELAEKAGAEYVISGSLGFAEGKTKGHLTLTLHHIRQSGEVRDTPLGHYDIPLLRASEDIRSYARVRDHVVQQVVATVTPAFMPQSASALTPRDRDAYRLYLLARERLAAGGCDGEAAIELLRRSLEIDPKFAPAWEAYGWAEYALCSSCTQDASHYDNALKAAERALQLAPSMPGAQALETAVLVAKGRIEQAHHILRGAIEKSPDNADLEALMSYVLGHAGYNEQARTHLERVASLDPNYLTVRGRTPSPYLYLGQTERFVGALPGTDAPVFRYYRGLADLLRGRREDAYRTLEPAFRLNPSDAYARLSQALLAVLDERPDEAREVVRQFIREREMMKASDGEMTYRTAQILILAGDHKDGLTQLAKAVERGFFSVGYIESDPILEPVRQSPDYLRIRDAARARHIAFGKFLRPRAQMIASK